MDQNEKIIEFFYANAGTLSKISVKEVQDVITLASTAAVKKETTETMRIKAFILLADIAAQPLITLEERWTLYQLLRSEDFNMEKYNEYALILDKIYGSIYLDVKKSMPDALFCEMPDRAEEKAVVIVTDQFLTETHGPTRSVLDYAYTIQQEMKIPVVIINEAGTHAKNFSYLSREPEFEYIPELTKQKTICYKEAEFRFYQTASEMLDLQEIANIVYSIRELSPRLVLTIGRSCLSTDLCRYFTKTAVISKNNLSSAPNVSALTRLFSNLDVKVEEKTDVVDGPKFRNIFDQESEEGAERIESRLDRLTATAQLMEARLKENEWAFVFNSTIQGSEWLQGISLSPGRAALGYPGLYAMYRSLDEFRPKHILEMGLGQSTRVIGAYAEYFQAEHYVVENDKSWVDFFLKKHGIKENTEIVCLEVKEEIYQGKRLKTDTPIRYYEGFAEAFAGKKFDFIFIDGPNGSKEYSRVDILELLPECLEDSFVIMVDDSERGGEWNTINMICDTLKKSGIAGKYRQYEGLKDTTIIVSKDLKFLCTL